MNSIRSRCGEWMKYKIVRLFLLCTVSAFLTAALSGAAIAKYAVIIEDEGTRAIVYTSESDPDKILEKQNIALGKHDTITFSGFSGKEGTIRVNRASLVSVKADGAEQSVYIAEGTVADALDALHVTVGNDDLINVALTEPVNNDMEVVINRMATAVVTKVSVLPHTTNYIPTQTLANGKTRTLKEGSDGELTTTLQQVLKDGKVIEETVVSEEVTKAPVTARVLKGDDNAPTSCLIPDEEIALDQNGNPVNYVAKVTGKATAYSALGRPTKLVPGCVAMDLSQYPRGSRLYIKTPDGSFIYGYSEVRDTGPAVKKGIILVDLFFGSYRESCLFGAKTVDIYVLP